MMRSVYLKTLYDKRWFIFGWTLGFMALTILMVSFYPAMHQDGTLDELVATMPPALKGLVGNLDNLKHFDTYIASQLFDIRMSLIAGIMAIILALGLSTNEEESKELRTWLSLPLSRTKVLFHKWFALGTIMAIAVLGIVVAMYGVAPFIEGATIDRNALLQLVLMTWLIMVTYGTITLAAGFALGSRGAATLISIVAIIGSFILSTFGQAVDWLEKFEPISLLHYFPAVDIVKHGISIGDLAVLCTVTIIALAIGWFRFRVRDIA